MPDVFTKAKRSEVMSRIRSRGNKDTELKLAAFFRRHKITGWRRHLKLSIRSSQGDEAQIKKSKSLAQKTKLIGASSRRLLQVRPDFVFPKLKLAVFVDGCFWHGCPQHGTRPKGNAAFWRKKISGNQLRDRLVGRTLRKAGWRVLRIWEHELARKREPALIRLVRHFF